MSKSFQESDKLMMCDLPVFNLQILLDNCQLLKLSDFTLAQSMEESDRRVQHDLRRAAKLAFGELQSGGSDIVPAPDTVPSPFYAAPELFEGSRFDVASDLWSMGVLTYELCTGKQLISNGENILPLNLHAQ